MPVKHSKKLKNAKRNPARNFRGNFLSSTFQNTLRSWRKDEWQINSFHGVQYPAVKVLDLFFKKIVYWLSFAAISLIFSFAIQIFAAWSPPISTPPSDNVSAPLDASINFQTKTGALGVGGVFETDGNTYLASNIGNVGIGTTSPSEKLVLNGGNFLQKSGNPRHVGSINTRNFSIVNPNILNLKAVYVSGKYAYIAAGSSDSLEIFDVSNPSNPRLVGFIINSDPIKCNGNCALDQASQIYVSGNYAYVTAGTSNGMEIADISNPYDPKHVGALKQNSPGCSDQILVSPGALYVSGKYAYIGSQTATGGKGLTVVDISNPAIPVCVGNAPINDPRTIYVSGKYAYSAHYNGGGQGLKITDISNPLKPVFIKRWEDTANSISVYVSGRYAYLTSGDTEGFHIIDVKDPNNPQEVGNFALDGPSVIFVSGNYAYITDDSSKALRIINISNPAALTEVGYIDRTSCGSNCRLFRPVSIFVSGKYLYLANYINAGASTLEIFDISGIDAPAANIGNIYSGNITVTENMDIGNNLYVRSGLNVGPNGFLSNGVVVASSSLETLQFLRMRATSTSMICNGSNGNEGKMYYSSTGNEPCYCGGAGGWLQFDGGGACP